MSTRTLVLATTVAAGLLSSAPTASAAPAKYPDDFNGDGGYERELGSRFAVSAGVVF